MLFVYVKQALLRYRGGAFLLLAGCIAVLSAGCSRDDGLDLNDPAVVYGAYCFACHDSGAINAPKLSDTAFWNRGAESVVLEQLYASTLKGKRAMPAKGTCLSCNDVQLKQVVDWMVMQSRH